LAFELILKKGREKKIVLKFSMKKEMSRKGFELRPSRRQHEALTIQTTGP
jgi:hypothetical protein